MAVNFKKFRMFEETEMNSILKSIFNVKNHHLNISGFFQNFYQNAVDMVKNLPSSSIMSSILDLGDDGGVSSLAIFFSRALSSVILNLREFQKYFHEFFLHHVLTFVLIGTVLQDYYD